MAHTNKEEAGLQPRLIFATPLFGHALPHP